MPKNMSQKQSPKRIVQFLFRLWKISPVLVCVMVAMQIIFAILNTTIAPIFVSQLFTHIAAGTATMDNSLMLLLGYSIIMFLSDVVAIRIAIAMSFITETKMQTIIAQKILKHLTNKSLNYHSNKMSGGMVSDANKLIGSIERFWDTIIWNLTPIVTALISVCVALSFIMWQYAVILAALSFVIAFVIIKSQVKIAPISGQVAKRSSKMTAYFADTISNISAVKAFANSKSELDRYQKLTTKWSKTVMKEMKSVVFITGAFATLMTFVNICAFAAAIFATEYHIAQIGSVYLVISYTLNVVHQLWQVNNATRGYLRVIGDAGPMIATLDEEIEIKDPVAPEKCVINKGKIEISNITFTHAENEKPLFNGFSLTINPGERVGVVGRSGSGKTSLTRLILRFSDIDKGTIKIDGQDITLITQDNLHESIAYVAQEPSLFHRTLRENIAYGKPNASDAEIRYAAAQANALDFIQSLSKGFNTLVGERGVKLSGGQRQRIVIARAILKNAPILILDEATSALDSESEKLIQDSLAKLMSGRTSIVIAHRLSTIAKLDRIIVLDEGKITEQGTHQELIGQNGIYSSLWSHQSGGFIEE
ncbi:MAG: ABC transporter ATP-binding protein [Candidatus Saccharibacteria bacterium]